MKRNNNAAESLFELSGDAAIAEPSPEPERPLHDFRLRMEPRGFVCSVCKLPQPEAGEFCMGVKC